MACKYCGWTMKDDQTACVDVAKCRENLKVGLDWQKEETERVQKELNQLKATIDQINALVTRRNP